MAARGLTYVRSEIKCIALCSHLGQKNVSLTLFDGDHPFVSLPYLDASDGGPLGQVTVESLPCTLIWEGYCDIG